MYIEKLSEKQIKEIIALHPVVRKWASVNAISLRANVLAGDKIIAKYLMPGGDSIAYRIVIRDFEVDASDFVLKNKLFDPSLYLEPAAAVCEAYKEENQSYRKYMASQFEGYAENCAQFLIDEANKQINAITNTKQSNV